MIISVTKGLPSVKFTEQAKIRLKNEMAKSFLMNSIY